MDKDRMLVVRVPADLIRALDGCVAEISRKTPAFRVNRSTVARALIERELTERTRPRVPREPS